MEDYTLIDYLKARTEAKKREISFALLEKQHGYKYGSEINGFRDEKIQIEDVVIKLYPTSREPRFYLYGHRIKKRTGKAGKRTGFAVLSLDIDICSKDRQAANAIRSYSDLSTRCLAIASLLSYYQELEKDFEKCDDIAFMFHNLGKYDFAIDELKRRYQGARVVLNAAQIFIANFRLSSKWNIFEISVSHDYGESLTDTEKAFITQIAKADNVERFFSMGTYAQHCTQAALMLFNDVRHVFVSRDELKQLESSVEAWLDEKSRREKIAFAQGDNYHHYPWAPESLDERIAYINAHDLDSGWIVIGREFDFA